MSLDSRISGAARISGGYRPHPGGLSTSRPYFFDNRPFLGFTEFRTGCTQPGPTNPDCYLEDDLDLI